MKCPKCQYFGFDSGDRCRNCGYDFSLAVETPALDLPIENGTEPIGPLGDFTLNDPNLPLFRKDRDPDAPLVAPNATPRAPLAVRRGAPTTTGRPAKPRRDRHDQAVAPRLALDTAEIPIVPLPAAKAGAPAPVPLEENGPVSLTAGAGSRVFAGAIDLILVGGIDLGVLYFTLKICDMTFLEAPALPLAPLFSFLVMLNGGYLSTFVAAGGQTIGKMAAGIRVVPADPAAAERVTFGHAAVRAAGYLVSALPAGLGFVPIFFGDRRALHDRLADTRVVKA